MAPHEPRSGRSTARGGGLLRRGGVGDESARAPRSSRSDYFALTSARDSARYSPATWPHPHAFVAASKGEQSLEIASQVLERYVTPEAHNYFRRIVQVTQSELEKLLVYKIQQLFDPVAPPTSAEMALEELGSRVSMKLQLPGASAVAALADAERRASGGTCSHFRSDLKEKAASEGRELTKHLVGCVGRILADFGRFADTVLRWQQQGGPSAAGPIGETGAPESNLATEEIVERLERQNRQNSALEAKYCTACTELRDNRRAFLRERALWREQLLKLKIILKRSRDPSLVTLLDHDVQFFGGDLNKSDHLSDEEMISQYEAKLAQLIEDYEDKIHALKEEMALLRDKVAQMEEREDRMKRRHLSSSQSLARSGSQIPSEATSEKEDYDEAARAERVREEVKPIPSPVIVQPAVELKTQGTQTMQPLPQFVPPPPTPPPLLAPPQAEVRRPTCKSERLSDMAVNLPPSAAEAEAKEQRELLERIAALEKARQDDAVAAALKLEEAAKEVAARAAAAAIEEERSRVAAQQAGPVATQTDPLPPPPRSPREQELERELEKMRVESGELQEALKVARDTPPVAVLCARCGRDPSSESHESSPPDAEESNATPALAETAPLPEWARKRRPLWAKPRAAAGLQVPQGARYSQSRRHGHPLQVEPSPGGDMSQTGGSMRSTASHGSDFAKEGAGTMRSAAATGSEFAKEGLGATMPGVGDGDRDRSMSMSSSMPTVSFGAAMSRAISGTLPSNSTVHGMDRPGFRPNSGVRQWRTFDRPKTQEAAFGVAGMELPELRGAGTSGGGAVRRPETAIGMSRR